MKQMTTNVGENVGKGRPSFILGRIADWQSTYGNECEEFLEA